MKQIECEQWTRCVGYMRPVSQWNPGKQEEFKDRKKYNPKRIAEDCSEYL